MSVFKLANVVTLVCCFLAVIQVTFAIKILYFFVPRVIEWGKSTTLQCHFDLENDRLYRVNWNKDNRRFYRFNARENHTEVAELKGVHVDRDRSNQTHLTLNNIDAHSEGVYSCEVQGKGPAFRTAHNEKKMSTYYLPKDLLRVEGVENSYKSDNFIKLTCASDPSFPATQLKWQINDKDALPSQVSEQVTITQPNGLKVTKLDLAFEATDDYFGNGGLKLKCFGSLSMDIDGTKKEIGDFSKSVEIRANYRLGSKPRHETEGEDVEMHEPDKLIYN
ncbi:uncharacterized protein B4U80_09979 [Leptotrombidium deliense]|uniref:Ig-like domain-containing protein n=1 Tax=Leptotrombidium deliense TaxID=299467 RepID=A0A443SCV3_9ACAR|nr:uncharacterized protein B4U80_09979 [Leptotrombidium deliense]